MRVRSFSLARRSQAVSCPDTHLNRPEDLHRLMSNDHHELSVPTYRAEGRKDMRYSRHHLAISPWSWWNGAFRHHTSLRCTKITWEGTT